VAKQIGTKIITIDGQRVVCAVYATRRVPGCNTFSKRANIKGKCCARARFKRQTEARLEGK